MDFVELLLLVFPAFISNGAPVVFGGGATVDFGMKFFDGKRVFGDSKTVRGLVSGIVAGTLAGAIVALLFPFMPWFSVEDKIILAFFASAGAMAGDLLGSFVKRRLGLAPGSQYFLLDQLLFLVVALLFIAYSQPVVFKLLNGWDVLWLLVLTYFLHLFFNWLAHKMQLKKVPW
ncbi:MAG: CDP-2,3-bis-(O-geranylgeranyl)-sn-glycerol synthase [Candidatus Norongarragalinales archaeon]